MCIAVCITLCVGQRRNVTCVVLIEEQGKSSCLRSLSSLIGNIFSIFQLQRFIIGKPEENSSIVRVR